tara:strand:- start:200 stop:487 length:288 start_codon:yes stop_codon:yes gene_type:complete
LESSGGLEASGWCGELEVCEILRERFPLVVFQSAEIFLKGIDVVVGAPSVIDPFPTGGGEFVDAPVPEHPSLYFGCGLASGKVRAWWGPAIEARN